jgi:glycosyltransferase involved in cell wall biosynthesis
MLSLSIVTPTYNRKKVISRSIDSSIELVEKGFAKNIIIVDDASTDGTFNFISNKYEKLINTQVLLIFRLDENSGVNKAKNIGVKMSQCEWIAFMDSDDYFLPEAGPSIAKELKSKNNYGVFFFRCLNIKTGCLIGERCDANIITFKQVLNDGIPGECLPVIKKKIMLKFPYNEVLKGCEGITHLKILKNGVLAFLSNKIVRGYDDSGEDRLCSKQSIMKRSKEMLQCNIFHLRYIAYASPRKVIGIIARIVYYSYLFIFRR